LIYVFDQELTHLTAPVSSGFTMSTITEMGRMVGDASGFRRRFALLRSLWEPSFAWRECT
jgi:hypothetical protein